MNPTPNTTDSAPAPSITPKLARMSKDEKRTIAAQALQALSGLVDLGHDTATIRRIAQEEAAKIRPARLEIVHPLGVRDLGERICHPLFDPVCRAVSVGVAPLIIGAAGSGKTTLAHQVADALGLAFHFSGAVNKKHELLGYTDAQGQIVRTAFRDAFENGGVFLFDEVDASTPAALLSVNAALSNGFCDFPDRRITAHADFRFIASANTNGGGATRDYCGRNQLDGATLDRFTIFTCDYDPSLTERLINALDLAPENRARAIEFARIVQDYREAMTAEGLRGVLSPRAALNGARLIVAGFSKREMIDALILQKFASAEDRTRLNKAANALTNLRELQEEKEKAAHAAALAKMAQEESAEATPPPAPDSITPFTV
jgi:cobaltochelatase CobS